MLRRFGTKGVAVAALALLAVAALAPVAEADHAYSHRYIVFGRVVDSAGNPVPGLNVDLGYQDFQPEGPCANQPNTETEALGTTRTTPVTNAYGEFIFCFHTHRMSDQLVGHGIVRLLDLDVTKEFDFDAYTRHSYVMIQLDSVHPNADTDLLDESYTIQGTAWRKGGADTYVDGVKVYGHTVDQAPVNITFAYNGKEPVTLTTTTNNYGDFAIRVPVTERPTTGQVTIEIAGDTETFSVDPTYGTTAAKVTLEKVSDPFLAKLGLVALVVAGVAIVGGGGWYGIRKLQAKREEQKAREGSARKRAKK